MNPRRNEQRKAVGSRGRTLDRVGETLDTDRLSDARNLMDRRPASALVS